ncbi:small GTP-binding protein [Tritrichomonas foetus]|uniref:Small GTP-binding protein n=1 Tax=Tritrichomonas foetus TaxID=1144522 RepID=A0A1J4KN14_9EUKA|nr:small GTP-binding protein [Tritrichomonas foetus]|eukprot:OHT12705.1 small GTP-binding protein [Tritrichomonas foetus]
MSNHKPKLVVVGDGGVGKTSIVVRYTRDQFTQEYEPTLAENYTTRIQVDDDTVIEIEIADTAGQDDFKALRDKFMAEGDVFLVVYSITDSRSLQMADTLLEQISILHENERFKFILAGNKCDLEDQRQVSKLDGKALTDKYHGRFLETSAKSGINVKETFVEIGKLLVEKNEKQEGNCCLIC